MFKPWLKCCFLMVMVGSAPVLADEAVVSQISAQACCATYADMPFMPIPNNEFEYTFELNSKSPVFAFPDGLSYFQTFQLPQQGRFFKIRVSSVFGKTVLIPTVQLLDSNLKIVREIKKDKFTVDYGNLGRKVYLTTVFELDNSSINPVSFIVLKADSSSIGGETQIMSAARKWAKESGLAQPVESDPIIPHSLAGELMIGVDVSGFRNEQGKAQTLGDVGKTTAATAVTVGSVAAAASSPANAPAVQPERTVVKASNEVVGGVSMLPETEEFYNQQIQKAVASGEIEKAMALTNEAERAGSRSAKQTFVNAVKSGQK